ncbi:MAG TPA: hypothetical protein VG102_02390 [Candidatus Paceibacterota bacterium]|jgi:uncharacterized membrane protein|nr:hypothetical protein [Candidatus Paceibacterota bacterium]
MNEFTAGSCVRFGWETFKKRPWFLIGIILLANVIYGVLSTALGDLQNFGSALAFLAFIASLAVMIVYKMGSVNFQLKAVDDVANLQLKDYWHPYPFWNYVLVTILIFLCCLLAFIAALVCAGVFGGIAYFIAGGNAGILVFLGALVVFAIIFVLLVVIRFLFAPYLVIARGTLAMDAMKQGAHMTEGNREKVLLLLVLLALVNILGLVCLIVGLLVSIPVSMIAMARAFRILEQKAGPTPVA